MKTYELIIERKQPSCGGKDPKDVKIQTVTIEDPLEYVRQIEESDDLEVTNTPEGELVITRDCGAKHIKYTFTED